MAMTFKPYKEESKKNWGTTIEENESITTDKIQLGCLLRIADATELMVSNYLSLQNSLEYARKSRDDYRRWFESEKNKNKALRGVITKLKKKLNP